MFLKSPINVCKFTKADRESILDNGTPVTTNTSRFVSASNGAKLDTKVSSKSNTTNFYSFKLFNSFITNTFSFS